MLNAYLIEDVRALADLVKINRAPKPANSGRFTSYRVRHPELAARQALVLLGGSDMYLKDCIPENVGRPIQVSVSSRGELYLHRDTQKIELEVFEFDSSPRLEALISPVPLGQSEHHEHDVSVIFWLHDPALAAEIVRRSLYLNNDRIQLAAIAHQEREVTLLRIESPSYYLLAWCAEQDDDRLTIHVPMAQTPGLYIQWGYRHPLEELWQRAWAAHPERMIFFPARSRHLVLERPTWQSLYELTEFSLELDEAQIWTQQRDEERARFEVRLKLAPRHEPAPTEVILLRDRDRDKLEAFLAMSDEADLERVEIAAMREPDGERYFFVRETHRGDGTLLLQLGGHAFARYKGFDNLLLPTTLVLEPQLRRDRYKKLFDLKPGVLSVVIPRENAQSARHIRVARQAFEPLKRFVDHIVHFEREALHALLDDSFFDLGYYRDAPSRAGMEPSGRRRGAGAIKEGGGAQENALGDEERRAKRLRAAKKRRDRRIELQARERDEEPEVITKGASAPSELELLEGELERELVRRGPLVELWRDLYGVKRERESWTDALTCAIEGLWSATFSPTNQDVAEAADDEAIRAFRLAFVESFERAEQAQALKPAYLILQGQAASATTTQGLSALMGAADALRSSGDQIGKKIQWLAWREVLSATQDIRAQEEIREGILEALNKHGLSPLDSAPFLRERILKDPELELDEELEDGVETSYALQNIEVVERAIEKLQTEKIRHASRASLARILSGMGMTARARELIEASLQGMDAALGHDSDDTRGWTSRVMDVFKTRSSERNTQRPERWHVWVALNASLIFQRVDPSKADEARRAYEFLFNQLQDFEKKDMRATAESLEARIGQQNVAEFLALDSRSFFSSRPLPEAMRKVARGLEQSQQDKKSGAEITTLVSQGVELAMKELTESAHPSLETVARLILEMVESLRRMKWDREQRPVERFQAFVQELPTRPLTQEASRLYFAVLHCAAARALMDLGREKEAMTRLADVIDWVGQDYMQVLDFVDLVKKEVLLAIELAPRNQRVEALRHLMDALVAQEKHEIGTDPLHPGAGFEMPFQAYEIIQMIDHTLEAAISNEKLVLRRLRDFEEREEARLRYWVQRDQPAIPS